ncbi:hypothetical protein IWW57_000273 [Coemansia sp. S610]|nr:hypothetical protein IWW57_000273 [Coemansia sp. S610]
MAVFVHHFNECELELEVDGNVSITRRVFPRATTCPNYYNLHLVRELEIRLDSTSVFAGIALSQLSRASYGEDTFPLVRTIHFFLSVYDDLEDKVDESLGSIGTHIADFVQHIRRMAPATNKIRLTLGCNFNGGDSITQNDSGDLVTQLYRTFPNVVHYSLAPRVLGSRLVATVRNLVHLDYYLDNGSCPHLGQLVQQSAASLQYLRIVLYEHFDITGLICHPNGAYVGYPYMHTMVYRVMRAPPNPLPIFKNAKPFASLRHLAFETKYPYGDDTPFRGNAAMLESLEFVMDRSTNKMLGDRKVFTPTSHPKLQHANTIFPIGDIPDHPDVEAASMRFALGIAPHAPVREIGNTDYGETYFTVELSRFYDYSSIQVLIVPRAAVQLWGVVKLISSLPLLSDLHTLLPTLGGMPVGMTSATLPDHVRASYASVGARFRCWRLDGSWRGLSEESAQCVLLLALICPNFDCVALLDGQGGKFMDILEATVYSDAFIQYAPRLLRLVFRC